MSTNQTSTARSFWAFLSGSGKASLAILGSFGGIGVTVLIELLNKQVTSPYLSYLVIGAACIVLLAATYRMWHVKFHEVASKDAKLAELEGQIGDLERRLINEPSRVDQFTSNFYRDVAHCQSVKDLLDTLGGNVLEELRMIHGFICVAMYVPKAFRGSDDEEDSSQSLKAYSVIRKGSRNVIKLPEELLNEKERQLVEETLPRRPLDGRALDDNAQRSYWRGTIPIAPPENGDFWGVLVIYAHRTQANSYEAFTHKLRDLKQHFLDPHLVPTFKYVWDIQQRTKALDGLFHDGFVGRRFHLILNNFNLANDGSIHFDPDTSVVDRSNANEFRDALNILKDSKDCKELLRRVAQGEEGVVANLVQENDRNLYVSLLPISPGPAAASGKRVLVTLDRDFNDRYKVKVEANWDVLAHMLKQMSSCERDPDSGLWNQAALHQHIERYLQGPANVPALGVFLMEVQASNRTRETKREIAEKLRLWLELYGPHPLQLPARHDGLRYAICIPMKDDKLWEVQAQGLISLLQSCQCVQSVYMGITIIESKVGLSLDEVLTGTFTALNEARNTGKGLYVHRVSRPAATKEEQVEQEKQEDQAVTRGTKVVDMLKHQASKARLGHQRRQVSPPEASTDDDGGDGDDTDHANGSSG